MQTNTPGSMGQMATQLFEAYLAFGRRPAVRVGSLFALAISLFEAVRLGHYLAEAVPSAESPLEFLRAFWEMPAIDQAGALFILVALIHTILGAIFGHGKQEHPEGRGEGVAQVFAPVVQSSSTQQDERRNLTQILCYKSPPQIGHDAGEGVAAIVAVLEPLLAQRAEADRQAKLDATAKAKLQSQNRKLKAKVAAKDAELVRLAEQNAVQVAELRNDLGEMRAELEEVKAERKRAKADMADARPAEAEELSTRVLKFPTALSSKRAGARAPYIMILDDKPSDLGKLCEFNSFSVGRAATLKELLASQ